MKTQLPENYPQAAIWCHVMQKKKFMRAGFEEREDRIMADKNSANNNPFRGCTIAATGKLENFTRDDINSRIISLGATASNSVTRKTDYLICGDKPGSKLVKAKKLGITVLTEQEFLKMIPA